MNKDQLYLLQSYGQIPNTHPHHLFIIRSYQEPGVLSVCWPAFVLGTSGLVICHIHQPAGDYLTTILCEFPQMTRDASSQLQVHNSFPLHYLFTMRSLSTAHWLAQLSTFHNVTHTMPMPLWPSLPPHVVWLQWSKAPLPPVSGILGNIPSPPSWYHTQPSQGFPCPGCRPQSSNVAGARQCHSNFEISSHEIKLIPTRYQQEQPELTDETTGETELGGEWGWEIGVLGTPRHVPLGWRGGEVPSVIVVV